MANERPLLSAYRELMLGHLIGTNKCPGVRPVGVGETWRWILAKCVLAVTGVEAKEACGTEKSSAGGWRPVLKVGFMQCASCVNSTPRRRNGCFYSLARNAYNEENRTDMLWAVRHKWPSGTRFALNCYRHWATLVIRSGDGMGHFLHRKEGVTQGDPLAMIEYGLGILPLIQDLRAAHPRVTQTWYCDDAGAWVNFAGIHRHLDDLMVRGAPRG